MLTRQACNARASCPFSTCRHTTVHVLMAAWGQRLHAFAGGKAGRVQNGGLLYLGEEDGGALGDEQEVRKDGVRRLKVVARHHRLQRVLYPLQHLHQGSKRMQSRPPAKKSPISQHSCQRPSAPVI